MSSKFDPAQAVNDSLWLSHNMLRPLVTGDMRDDVARRYIVECERVGARELAVWIFDMALMTRRIEIAPEGALDAPTDTGKVHGPETFRVRDVGHATTQVRYLASVAERAVSLGQPTSEDSILYAFGVTPVPSALDAAADPTPEEISAVRALVSAAR